MQYETCFVVQADFNGFSQYWLFVAEFMIVWEFFVQIKSCNEDERGNIAKKIDSIRTYCSINAWSQSQQQFAKSYTILFSSSFNLIVGLCNAKINQSTVTALLSSVGKAPDFALDLLNNVKRQKPVTKLNGNGRTII